MTPCGDQSPSRLIPSFGELFGKSEGEMQHVLGRDHGDISAFPAHFGDAERNRIVLWERALG